MEKDGFSKGPFGGPGADGTAGQIVVVRVGKAEFAVPMKHVVKVLLPAAGDIRMVGGSETVSFENRTIPLVDLASLLTVPEAGSSAPERTTAVILEYTKRLLALKVDGPAEEREATVQPMGSQIRRLRYFSGAIISKTGRVVPVLHVGDLFTYSPKATSGKK